MMRFFGTGAAETLPNPFCDCPVCAGIRRDGPQHFKNRSCFRVSEELMIDFGPDVIAAAHTFGEDFCALRHILFTHSHDDHLSFTNLSLIGMSGHRFPQPIELYFSPEAFGWVCCNIRAANPDFCFEQYEKEAVLRFGNENSYHLQVVPDNQWFTVSDFRVKAIRSSHPSWGEREVAWNYLIYLPDGRKMLYACDTGLYPDATLDALQGERLDLLIMECTFGSRKMEPGCGHLDAYSFLEMLRRFRQRDILRADTRVYSTHLNHKHTFTPLLLQDFFDRNAPLPVTVARDGQQIF